MVAASATGAWDTARLEWQVTRRQQFCPASVCVCGEAHLAFGYEIKNRITAQILFPVSAACVRLFESDAMTSEIEALKRDDESRRRVLFAMEACLPYADDIDAMGDVFVNQDLCLSDMMYLHRLGAFPATKYNGGNWLADVDFVCDLYRRDATPAQRRKLYMLMKTGVVPAFERLWAEEQEKDNARKGFNG